jgi:hypothetical protein
MQQSNKATEQRGNRPACLLRRFGADADKLVALQGKTVAMLLAVAQQKQQSTSCYFRVSLRLDAYKISVTVTIES